MEIGHSRKSHGSLCGWAPQELSRKSVGLGTPGTLAAVCGVGHSRESHGSMWGWALKEVVSAGEE